MVIPEQQLERVLARADSLSPKEAQALFAALAEQTLARCAKDGLFWLKFVQTRDEADPEHPTKKFPLHESYTAALWNDLVAHPVNIVAKSRQMFVSWEIACFCVWRARFNPNQAVYYQCQGWPDAVEKTAMPEGGFEGRMQFIENHLPEWMRVKCKFTEGRIQYPNGSIIQGLAGGANQVRGKTPSLYIGDEFAFMEEQDRVWTSVAPLIQKGAKAIIVSTPNGTGNMFATLYHGRPVGEEQVPQ